MTDDYSYHVRNHFYAEKKNLATFQIDGNVPLSIEQFMIWTKGGTTCTPASRMRDALILSRPVALHS